MTILLSQEDLDTYGETTEIEQTEVAPVVEDTNNVVLSQDDLEKFGGITKSQTTAHIDEASDPLFQDDEVSMGTKFAYGFQKQPTDVENLAIYLEAKYPMPGWSTSHTLPSKEGSSFFKSVDELYGEGFEDKPEDERRELIQQYRQEYIAREYPVLSAKEKTEGSEYDRSWSEAVGAFTGLLATPTTLVPIGHTYKAASGIGALLGFSYGVTEGLAEKGEVDWNTTGTYTAGGAVLSPLMIWGGRQFTTRFKKAMDTRNLKKQTKSAEELINTYDSLVYEAVHKGETDPTLLFKRLNQMLGVTNDDLTQAAKLAERKIYVPTKKEADLYFETIAHVEGKAAKPGGGFDEYLGVLSTRVKNINVPIWHRLRKLEYNQHARLHTNYTEVAPFLEGLSKVKGPEKDALILSLYNGKNRQVEALLKKQGNMELLDAFKATQQTLNKLHQEATDAGLTLGYKENYFPRIVKDVDGMQQYFGKDRRDEILRMIEDAAIAKGEILTKAEQADVVNNYLIGKKYLVGGKFTAFNKERKIEIVTPELLKFYENPEQALHTYIRRVVSETEKKKFFGNAWEKGGLDSTDIDESIGRLLLEERRIGNVAPGDATELGRLLQLRFGPGEQGPKKWIQASKSILYAQTLGNPVSAVTQLGDIFLSSYKNGIKPTVQALLSKKKIKLADYGFTDIAEEFASKTRTAEFMRKTFKWGGFSRVDRLGKETLLNSSFLKYTKEVSTPAGMKAFRKKWRKAFGDDINELAENLKNGNVDNDQVRLLLWHDLSDMQPISLSEMPAKYLASPDGRALYMLKTFTIKQFDIMRRDAFQLMKNKETRAEGVKNLIKYATIFTAGNMTSDSIKSWMLGREYDIEDSSLNSLWRLIGLSKYSGEQLGDKPLDVIWGLAKPPINIWGDMLSAAQDAMDFDDDTEASDKWVKGVPIVGKPVYEHLLGGKEEYQDKMDKQRRGFRRGGIVAQANRLGFNEGGNVQKNPCEGKEGLALQMCNLKQEVRDKTTWNVDKDTKVFLNLGKDNVGIQYRRSFNKGGEVSQNTLPISTESQILVDNENVPFVDRIINPQDYPYPDENKDGSISTHLLSAEVDEDGSAYVFPTKVYQDKGYKTYTENERFQALEDAKAAGNAIKFDDIDKAVDFSKNYKTDAFKKYYRRKPLTEDVTSNLDKIYNTPSNIGDAWGKRALNMQETIQRAKKGDINALKFAYHIFGDLFGGAWDTGGELIGTTTDTARVNARYTFPDAYSMVADTLNSAGKKALETDIAQKGLKTAGDIYEWYQSYKEEDPIGAKDLEAGANLFPLAFLKFKGLNNQMDDLNIPNKKDNVLEGEVLSPETSKYQFKPNSDTPHIDVNTTERFKYIGEKAQSDMHDVNKLFNPDVINKALQSTDKNTNVVYMTPGQFLTLAKTHTSTSETKKLDRVNKAINDGKQLEDIPTLTMTVVKGTDSKVTNHDGRHRAMALEGLGIGLIPVRVVTEGVKEGVHLRTVTNEDGNEVYSFPHSAVYNRQHYGDTKTIENKRYSLKDNSELVALAEGLTESGGFKYKLPTMLLDLTVKEKIAPSKPSHWKYTISRWAKKGKIKKEELEDSRIMNWLESQDKETKISTEDIFTFMQENSPMLKTYTSKVQSKADMEWLNKQPLYQKKTKLQEEYHNKLGEVAYLQEAANISSELSPIHTALIKETADWVHHVSVEDVMTPGYNSYITATSDPEIYAFLLKSPYNKKAIKAERINAKLLNDTDSIFHPDNASEFKPNDIVPYMLGQSSPEKRNGYIAQAIIERLNQAYIRAPEGRRRKELLGNYVDIMLASLKAKLTKDTFEYEKGTKLRKLSKEAMERTAGDVSANTWGTFALPNMRGKPVTILVQSKVGKEDRLKKLKDFRDIVAKYSASSWGDKVDGISTLRDRIDRLEKDRDTNPADQRLFPISRLLKEKRFLKERLATFKKETGVAWDDRHNYIDNVETDIYKEPHWTGTYGESPLKKGIPQENIFMHIRGNIIKQDSLGRGNGLFITEQQAQPHQEAMGHKINFENLAELSPELRNISGYAKTGIGVEVRELIDKRDKIQKAVDNLWDKAQKATLSEEYSKTDLPVSEHPMFKKVSKLVEPLDKEIADIDLQLKKLTGLPGNESMVNVINNTLPDTLSHKKDWTPLAMKQSIKYAIDNNLNYLVLPIERHTIDVIEQWGGKERGVMQAIIDRNSIYSPRAYRDIVRKWDKDAKPFESEYIDRDGNGDWGETDIHKVIVLPITEAIKKGFKEDGLLAYRRGGLVTQMKALTLSA